MSLFYRICWIQWQAHPLEGGGRGAWVQVSSDRKRPALTDETEDWPN